MASCSSNRHRPVSIIFGSRHQHTFRDDVPVKISFLHLPVYLLYLPWNSSDANDAVLTSVSVCEQWCSTRSTKLWLQICMNWNKIMPKIQLTTESWNWYRNECTDSRPWHQQLKGLRAAYSPSHITLAHAVNPCGLGLWLELGLTLTVWPQNYVAFSISWCYFLGKWKQERSRSIKIQNILTVTIQRWQHHTPLILVASFCENLVRLVPECQTIVDFAAARDDGDGSCDNWNTKIRCAKLQSNYQHTNTQCL